MSTLKSSNDHLTLNADGTSKDIKFQADGVEKASISSAGAFTSTTIDATKLTGNLPAISGASLTGISSGTTLTGSTNNTIPTVTGANAISGEANLTFDGTDLTLGTGDIVFGTAGKGICLGVTSNTDANTLDDYEEGTWTPESQGGTAYSLNGTAKYTKIGNIVHVQADINQIPSGNANKIYGIPFSNSGQPYGAMSVGYNSYATGVTINIESNNSFRLFVGSTAVNSNNHRFVIGGTYIAT